MLNPNKLRDFYKHLQVSKAVSVPARWELFVLGDFNSKRGKPSLDDIQNGLYLYMGNSPTRHVYLELCFELSIR